MNKTKVAFICVHESCRSKIAEALGIQIVSDIFASDSAGTEIKSQINQDAVARMRESYDIDMEFNVQYNNVSLFSGETLPRKDDVSICTLCPLLGLCPNHSSIALCYLKLECLEQESGFVTL